MSVSSQDFKNKFFKGMSFAAATVNVITSDGPAGRVGLTVSAMSSVSADTPRPTLLICVNENSSAAAPILKNGVFCVNILHNHQSFISDVFAGRYKEKIETKFDCTTWVTGETGAPRVADVLVGFDCRIVSTKKVGTHHVIFGEVVDITVAEKGSALIYANRSYGSAQPIVVPSSVKFRDGHTPDTLSIGCFHTFAPYFIPGLIKDFTKQEQGLSVSLVEGDNRRIKEALVAGEVEVALMYDFDLPDNIETMLLSKLTPYVLLAEDHPLAKHEEIKQEDLHDEPMISVAEDVSRDKLEGELRVRGIEPNVIFRAASFEMMRGMVSQGLGFALALTRSVSTRSYEGKTLVTRPMSNPLPSCSVVLAKRKDEELSKAATQVFDKAHALSSWT